MPGLVETWWLLAVRGLLAVLFGLAALIWPGITLGWFVLLFGAYVVIDGLCTIVHAIRAAERPVQSVPALLEGAVCVGLGVLAWAWPFLRMPPVLLYLVASWGILTGVLEIVGATSLRHEPTGQWLFALAGVSSVVIGVFLMLLPHAGSIVIVKAIGVYALVFGGLVLASARRLHQWQRASRRSRRPA